MVETWEGFQPSLERFDPEGKVSRRNLLVPPKLFLVIMTYSKVIRLYAVESPWVGGSSIVVTSITSS